MAYSGPVFLADVRLQDTIQGGSIPAHVLFAAGNDKSWIAPRPVAHRLEESFEGLGINELDAEGVPVAMGQLDEPVRQPLEVLLQVLGVFVQFFPMHLLAHFGLAEDDLAV